MTDAIFLDTTIQIARAVGSRDLKRAISQRLAKHPGTVLTSYVVRQEWKRRLLTDARYVLINLRKCGLHVGDTLRLTQKQLSKSRENSRKLSISIELIATHIDSGAADSGERFELFLTNLIENGTTIFDHGVLHVIAKSGCGCASANVRVEPSGKYDIGPQRCRTASRQCAIAAFLKEAEENARVIKTYLDDCESPKSSEILKAHQFLDLWLAGTAIAEDANPCLTLGDLIIALESAGVPVFYTKNRKESQHFCKALGQEMIVRPDADSDDDVVYHREARWPIV